MRVKAALTATNKQRNWALRKAEELLKAAEPEAKVELAWPERAVKVNGEKAFSQDKTDTRGSFLPPFTKLSLPN